MTLTTARTVFAIPPFPGARPHAVVQAATEVLTANKIAPAALIDALRRHRIGGAYWIAGQDPCGAPQTEEDPDTNDSRALLAAIMGRKIHIEGNGPFAALSRLTPFSPGAESALKALVEQYLLNGLSYHDPFTGSPISPLRLVEILAGWRELIASNRPIAAAFGFAHWKRDTVDPLLWGGAPVPYRAARERILTSLPDDATIAVWKARVPTRFLARLEAGPWRLLEVEDGFIRSAGLGADCVPPLSIVVDDLGVHYDPTRPNRLEVMLAKGGISREECARARELRDWLVREGVSKYGAGAPTALSRPAGTRRHILVVGQVEDDRSVRFGGGAVQSNLELLRRVRALEPDAYLIYRPHPDVEAGHRHGAIPDETALSLADAIDARSPISALIAMVDAVHVITSLAGFEALLHDKSVTTHGVPFYAGWGLTQDLGPVPARRGVQRPLDELVAAVLLRYPRYLDPVTNLPCTAEILVMRLLSGNRRQNEALVPLRRFLGWAKRASTQFVGMR